MSDPTDEPRSIPPAADDTPALPRPIQEELARQLRGTYQTVSEKPAYLGDPALPPQFEEPVRKLARSIKAHDEGVEAVRRALDAEDDERV